jgi:hypothetical protein
MENIILGIILIVLGFINLWRIYKGKSSLGWSPPTQTYLLKKSNNKALLNFVNIIWGIVIIISGVILLSKSFH